MKRNIVEIDEEKCDGCGACALACQEGAIALVDGKARLIRDDICDGLGACLPACPADAIRIVEREAVAFDAAAISGRDADRDAWIEPEKRACGCPGMQARAIVRERDAPGEAPDRWEREWPSRLSQWPVQIALVPVKATWLDGARLLVAADCSAYACASFHERFIKGHITLIGCPKLGAVDDAEKLAAIIASNDIRSVTVVRMEVPCCGGIEQAVKSALIKSQKFIPWRVVTLTTAGDIIE